MIQVLIADDHRLVREGLRALLDREKDIQVIGEARDGRNAVELARQLNPDVVLMDIKMPLVGGVEAIEQIHAAYPDLVILVVAMSYDRAEVQQAVKNGAKGFFSKLDSYSELAPAIRTVYAGGTYFSPNVSQLLDGTAMAV